MSEIERITHLHEKMAEAALNVLSAENHAEAQKWQKILLKYRDIEDLELSSIYQKIPAHTEEALEGRQTI